MFIKIVLPLLFALIAAVGNAVYVFGVRKSTPMANPFLLTAILLSICVLMSLIASLAFGMQGMGEMVKKNWVWWMVSGGGAFLTYLGFYLLFSRYGASSYTLYAVISILTTSILVGQILFHEPANLYSGLSIFAAVVSILFWGMSRM